MPSQRAFIPVESAKRGRHSNGVWFDVPSKKTSKRMQQVKSVGTKLEAAMAKILRSAGIRFKAQPKLPGRRDFQVKGTKLLLFCDSSFWHGRRQKDLDGRVFSKNRRFWIKKLLYNKLRDAKNNRYLRRHRFNVLRFWDDDILKKQDKVIKKITQKFGKYGT